MCLSEEDDDDRKVDCGSSHQLKAPLMRLATYPSMLIKQPKGTENLDKVLGTPRSITHFIVRGKVAAEEAVPHAVIHALEHLNQ